MVSENGFVAFSEYEDLLKRYEELEKRLEEKKYFVEDYCNGNEFEVEMTFESYLNFLEIRDRLGYVMEDIGISEEETFSEEDF